MQSVIFNAILLAIIIFTEFLEMSVFADNSSSPFHYRPSKLCIQHIRLSRKLYFLDQFLLILSFSYKYILMLFS